MIVRVLTSGLGLPVVKVFRGKSVTVPSSTGPIKGRVRFAGYAKPSTASLSYPSQDWLMSSSTSFPFASAMTSKHQETAAFRSEYIGA
jgi:hypothetical protein